jgi:hypothetical protein
MVAVVESAAGTLVRLSPYHRRIVFTFIYICDDLTDFLSAQFFNRQILLLPFQHFYLYLRGFN